MEPDIQDLMGRASILEIEEGTFFGEVPGARGVWATAETEAECRAELQSVLEGWVDSKNEDREETLVFMLPREPDAIIPSAVLERILRQLGATEEERQPADDASPFLEDDR